MTTLLLHVSFAFVVVGTKLLLALWAIYYLFPATADCPECDAVSLPVEMGAARRVCGTVLFLGRVRYRWCPECGWSGFARAVKRSRPVPVHRSGSERLQLPK